MARFWTEISVKITDGERSRVQGSGKQSLKERAMPCPKGRPVFYNVFKFVTIHFLL